MYLIHAHPISRGISNDELTYFSSETYPEGALIFVPLRSKIVPALVVQSERVSDAKASIRSADFAIRKVAKRAPRFLFSSGTIRALQKVSNWHASSLGAILSEVVPRGSIENAKRTPIIEYGTKGGASIERVAFQGTMTERFEEYRNLVREEFAKKRSVLLLAPTRRESEALAQYLARGISEYTFLLHGGLPATLFREQWSGAHNSAHPVLIIGTPSSVALPRHDIGTIIIERETATTWRRDTRPYIDFRIVAEEIANEYGARFLVADMPLRIETVYRMNAREFEERGIRKTRVSSPPEMRLIDARPRIRKELEQVSPRRERFRAIHPELAHTIQKMIQKPSRVFLFAARRGLAPITVCDDCGSPVVDDATGLPVVLHKSARGNVFVCHASGTVRSANERCRFCGSWKLSTLGIGAELVEEEARERFPDVPVFSITKDSTPKEKEAEKTARRFKEAPRAILVGTELALSYLPDALTLSAVVSLDSLLSAPEWNIHDRIFSILMRIRERTEEAMIIQTRQPERSVVIEAVGGAIADYYKTELNDRRRFGYPPFSTLIKISCVGSKERVSKRLSEVETMLLPFTLSGHTHVMNLPKGRSVIHGFIRLPQHEWVREDLLEKIRLLPPDIAVTINPDSIL